MLHQDGVTAKIFYSLICKQTCQGATEVHLVDAQCQSRSLLYCLTFKPVIMKPSPKLKIIENNIPQTNFLGIIREVLLL